VIDCYVETNDGIVLLDFKTDHIRPGQEAERAETYRIQLTVYAEAISRILRKPAKRCCLYFFATGQAVDLRL
ncbi:MAG: PD-(D/E)XK nuclease family protein, partial [Oscillospiraceae bacterium]|nr:PD-(D/E)XK nuclease family protein [Oscillospiraceae bacterium]